MATTEVKPFKREESELPAIRQGDLSVSEKLKRTEALLAPTPSGDVAKDKNTEAGTSQVGPEKTSRGIAKDEVVVEGLKEVWGKDITAQTLENANILNSEDPGEAAKNLLNSVLEASSPDNSRNN